MRVLWKEWKECYCQIKRERERGRVRKREREREREKGTLCNVCTYVCTYCYMYIRMFHDIKKMPTIKIDVHTNSRTSTFLLLLFGWHKL